MKRFIVTVFATTGMSLVLLSAVALGYRAEYLYIPTVFQTFGANLVIQLGLLLLHRRELKHPISEMIGEVLIVIVTLMVFGAMFRWFGSTPIWVLVIMGLIMYAVSLVLDLMSMKKEVRQINALIRKNRNTE